MVPTSNELFTVARGFESPSGLAFDELTGDLFVSEYRGERVRRVSGLAHPAFGINSPRTTPNLSQSAGMVISDVSF